ncbi:MAG: cyclic nucleotide-binding domain-containing protein [Deltaproteobacteria bacterium]|jgi:CRP-like cAMP-binding protein|nr:cyclic nucleotide-binding domain-containing protein [Deltaproteobacteria bacterium]
MSSSETNKSTPSSEFQENLEILRQIYFFSGLPLETLKIFAYLCTREKFKQGEHIFRQDEDDGQAFYIIGGRARLERQDNGETRKVRDCETGEFLGGLTLLGETRRLFSLKSVSDTTCLVLNREKFSKTMGQFPDLMMKICKAVAHSIDTWEKRFLTSQGDQCGECMERLGVTLI